MKAFLIPVLLSSSTKSIDNTARYNGIEFVRIMSKFPDSNLDGLCPATITNKSIVINLEKGFMESFEEIENKAIRYFKQFSSKYLKRFNEFNFTMGFCITIEKDGDRYYAFVHDNLSTLKMMRFMIEFV